MVILNKIGAKWYAQCLCADMQLRHGIYLIFHLFTYDLQVHVQLTVNTVSLPWMDWLGMWRQWTPTFEIAEKKGNIFVKVDFGTTLNC